MLAHPTTGIGEVLKRFGKEEFACEWKYDGERAQIHMLEDGSMHIYSRNQEDNTTKYPDIIERMPKLMKDGVKSFIIDCEAVAYDTATNEILPFQRLSTRKKKDVSAEDVSIQVCVYPFDLLYLNGKSYVREPFKTRRELLRSSFEEKKGELFFATSHIASDPDRIAELLDQSIKDKCEGLMVKTLEGEKSKYEISKRSKSWLKLKKDYLDGVGDTLDLVVIGGWIGKGKRTGTYGAFLLACYDEDSEEYQSICKIGTGFSDEDLKDHYASLKPHVIPGPKGYFNVSDNSLLQPDVWFDAHQVWEVKCADLSISPAHKAAAGLVDEEKGISLRFPRFLRVRDDKSADNATSAEQVAELYKNQDNIVSGGGDAGDDEY